VLVGRSQLLWSNGCFLNAVYRPERIWLREKWLEFRQKNAKFSFWTRPCVRTEVLSERTRTCTGNVRLLEIFMILLQFSISLHTVFVPRADKYSLIIFTLNTWSVCLISYHRVLIAVMITSTMSSIGPIFLHTTCGKVI
jgi:hypothetical protein